MLHQSSQALIFPTNIRFQRPMKSQNFNSTATSKQITDCSLHIINRQIYTNKVWAIVSPTLCSSALITNA